MLFKGSKYLSLTTIRLCLLALLVSGCSMGSPNASVVQVIADKFYKAQQQQNLDEALGYFSDKRSAEDWRTHLTHIADNLGKVESFEYKGVETNTMLSGRLYIFDYQVAYSSGKQAKETLTLFDTLEEDDTAAIVSHMVMAEGYDQLF